MCLKLIPGIKGGLPTNPAGSQGLGSFGSRFYCWSLKVNQDLKEFYVVFYYVNKIFNSLKCNFVQEQQWQHPKVAKHKNSWMDKRTKLVIE